jgi:hypothetical protein
MLQFFRLFRVYLIDFFVVVVVATFRKLARDHFDNLMLVFRTASYTDYEQLCNEDNELTKHIVALMLYENCHIEFLSRFIKYEVQHCGSCKRIWRRSRFACVSSLSFDFSFALMLFCCA